MKKKSDHILRTLLSQCLQQDPPPHFTEDVMREIEAMEADRVRADIDLLIMLKKSATAAPSKAFTHSVLKKIREPEPAIYKPVISANAWRLIVASLLTFIILALTGQSSTDSAFFSNPIAEYLSDALLTLNESLVYFEIVAVAGSGLLLLDYFLTMRPKANLVSGQGEREP
jgi:hypothetical protein